MAKRTVFSDENNNELDYFINDKGQLYISVGAGDVEQSMYNGYIALEKDDVDELIKVLPELSKQMDDA